MQQFFRQYFGEDAQYHIFSPYRVCPLGAHVDHQHGLVTGFAFDKGVDWEQKQVLVETIEGMLPDEN